MTAVWRSFRVLGVTLAFFLGVLGVGLVCLIHRVFGTRLPYPANLEQLAARQEWLTKVLRSSGALPDEARVDAVEVVPFREGEVFRSTMGLVTVRFDGDQVIRLVAKFAPWSGLWNQIVFTLQANHTKEVGLYDRLAPDVAPRALFAKADPLSGNLCLLLEYLSNAREYSELEGCPVDAAHAVMRSLAQFHAQHWRGARPTGRPSTKKAPAIGLGAYEWLVALVWGRRFRPHRRLMLDTFPAIMVPQTVVHGDARVGNVLFDDGRAWLIDWQAMRWGLAALDVSYFLLLSMTPEDRVAHTESLLDTYHAALVAGGVADYSREALDADLQAAVSAVPPLLWLPMMSGEVSLDVENRELAIAGGVVWTERICRAWATHEADGDVDLHALVKVALQAPPTLNGPARQVAQRLAETGRDKELLALLLPKP